MSRRTGGRFLLLANERGMALFMTLALALVIVSLVVGLSAMARQDAEFTRAVSERIMVREMAVSGIHLAMAVLAEDRNISSSDHLEEDWANADVLAELVRELGFEPGALTVAITDERSRLQVNALVRGNGSREFHPGIHRVLLHLLEASAPEINYAGSDIESPGAVIGAIKDWIDRGDDEAVTGLNGAESEYYERLPTPYACPNTFMQVPEEMLLIRGMRPEWFYGTEDKPGLAAYLSVFGWGENTIEGDRFDGRVNINTAPVPVIRALLPEDARDMAEAIADFRSEPEIPEKMRNVADPKWYRNAPGCGNVEIDPDLVTVASDIFRVQSTARQRDRTFTIQAVVLRVLEPEAGRWHCRILQWRPGADGGFPYTQIMIPAGKV